MNKHRSHNLVQGFDLHRFENIEDKKVIHEFEYKNLVLDLDNLKDKYILNQLR